MPNAELFTTIVDGAQNVTKALVFSMNRDQDALTLAAKAGGFSVGKMVFILNGNRTICILSGPHPSMKRNGEFAIFIQGIPPGFVPTILGQIQNGVNLAG